eukprot:CAMPEP_0194193892 /NCGR_PEP_ID=MMETSP0154-20130528/75285_1 /TAXON_ID=1049557 /ORGANISM="Thalassiothrix antarctica, Strain L6-D1" /LENGTH=494 /DNA_ID=CAMNT_0038918269 /DNA_START=63 /DNA_END=1547 /DNA_ORIENTATION=+
MASESKYEEKGDEDVSEILHSKFLELKRKKKSVLGANLLPLKLIEAVSVLVPAWIDIRRLSLDNVGNFFVSALKRHETGMYIYLGVAQHIIFGPQNIDLDEIMSSLAKVNHFLRERLEMAETVKSCYDTKQYLIFLGWALEKLVEKRYPFPKIVDYFRNDIRNDIEETKEREIFVEVGFRYKNFKEQLESLGDHFPLQQTRSDMFELLKFLEGRWLKDLSAHDGFDLLYDPPQNEKDSSKVCAYAYELAAKINEITPLSLHDAGNIFMKRMENDENAIQIYLGIVKHLIPSDDPNLWDKLSVVAFFLKSLKKKTKKNYKTFLEWVSTHVSEDEKEMNQLLKEGIDKLKKKQTSKGDQWVDDSDFTMTANRLHSDPLRDFTMTANPLHGTENTNPDESEEENENEDEKAEEEDGNWYPSWYKIPDPVLKANANQMSMILRNEGGGNKSRRRVKGKRIRRPASIRSPTTNTLRGLRMLAKIEKALIGKDRTAVVYT